MDEIFDETNFRNEIILPRPFTKNLQQQFSMISSLNVRHDTLLCYSKKPETKFRPIWVDKEVIVHPDDRVEMLPMKAVPQTRAPQLQVVQPADGWVPPGGYDRCTQWALENREALEVYAGQVAAEGTAAEQLQHYLAGRPDPVAS